ATELDAELPLAALGVDSLAAIELQHRLESELSLTVELPELFATSLAALATLAASATGERPLAPPPIAPPTAEEFPLSPGQRALWFLSRRAPGSAAYHVAFAAWLRLAVDLPALRRAFGVLVERPPVLGTPFLGRFGEPVQRVGEGVAAPLLVVDAEALSPRAIQALLGTVAAAPFDLAAGPPLRILVVLGPGGRKALLL